MHVNMRTKCKYTRALTHAFAAQASSACYHTAMNDFDKRWQRISQLLSMEATGKERPMFSSGRTLFGIKSTAEEKMDQFAREIEEEHAAKRKAAREAERETEREGQHRASRHGGSCEAKVNPASSSASGQQTRPLPSASPSPRFSASTDFIRSSVEELTDRALKQAIRDANKKLEDDYKSGKITRRKKFNAD